MTELRPHLSGCITMAFASCVPIPMPSRGADSLVRRHSMCARRRRAPSNRCTTRCREASSVSKAAASYLYRDAHGKPLARIDRIQPQFDGASKSFDRTCGTQ